MVRTLLCCFAFPFLAAAQIHVTEHDVAGGLGSGYHVTVADINHDGKPDLVALGLNMTELVWFQNPNWERHVIAANVAHMVNCAVVEVNGQPQIVNVTEFNIDTKKGVGIISVLRPGADPTAPWSSQEIDRLPASHRVRVADIDGSGKPVVVVAPIDAVKSEAPDYRDYTPLVYYVPGEWKRREIKPENFGVVHGIYITDWDGDKRDQILTAGFQGIQLFKFTAQNEWTRTEITKGDPSPWPKSGSSEVAAGHLGRERFLAAIEAWHGNQMVVYHSQNGAWTRQVVDDTLLDGHAIETIDVDGDGRDEIVAGCRRGNQELVLYRADDPAGQHWSKQVIETNGMAAAACTVADLNGDHRPDLACIGSGTANLRWYEFK